MITLQVYTYLFLLHHKFIKKITTSRQKFPCKKKSYSIFALVRTLKFRPPTLKRRPFQEKDNKRQLRLRNGLITQHAYSVTGLARVRGANGEVPLVRLRNPWARGEWTGPWSERSWEWDGLSARDKELLSVRVTNDGEFW